MQTKCWVIVGPDGYVYLSTARRTRKDCIAISTFYTPAYSWIHAKAEGYRCVKATLTVEDKDVTK